MEFFVPSSNERGLLLNGTALAPEDAYTALKVLSGFQRRCGPTQTWEIFISYSKYYLFLSHFLLEYGGELNERGQRF